MRSCELKVSCNPIVHFFSRVSLAKVKKNQIMAGALETIDNVASIIDFANKYKWLLFVLVILLIILILSPYVILFVTRRKS